MSKMMDNLARVREEEQAIQKPSLFLVRDQAPPSAQTSPKSESRRKTAIVWSLVAVSVLTLASIFVLNLPESAVSNGSPSSTPAASFQEAISLIREKNFKNAEAKLNQLLAENPKNIAYLNNRAYVLKSLGNLEAAENEYKSILRSAPADATVLNNLGVLFLNSNRMAEAEAMLAKAADAGSSDAKLNLAALREKEKDWESALKIFEEVLAGEVPAAHRVQIRERVRRLRSLAASTSAQKEVL